MQSGSISYARLKGIYVLKFSGSISVPLSPDLSAFGESLLSDPELAGVVIDLTDVISIDSTALGLLVNIAAGVRKLGLDQPVIISTDANVNRTLEVTGFAQVFHIIEVLPDSVVGSCRVHTELPSVDSNELEIGEKVLTAHRILMQLNENNRNTFRPVVIALEKEQQAKLSKNLS